MKKPEVHIYSYFSLETDLAGSFSEWTEFIEGKEYDVLLRSQDGQEVSTKYTSEIDDGETLKYVSVSSNVNGSLFQRVLGLVVYLMGGHSDDLQIHRWA